MHDNQNSKTENHEQEFLDFLSKDIDEHTENLVQLSTEMWNRITELTDGIDVDLDEKLEFDDED